MAYQSDPDYLKINQISFNSEHLYRTYTASYTAANSQHALISLTGGMPGDVVTARSPFGNAHATAPNWPAHAPAAGTLYTELDALWRPLIYYTPIVATATTHVIRAITRAFTPLGGWDVTLAVEPVTTDVRGSDVSISGNGTY
jgi:hypothetical protein